MSLLKVMIITDLGQRQQEVSNKKIGDVVTLGTFCYWDQSFINRRGSVIFSRKERY